MDYDEFRALAVDLIGDFGNGRQATIYRASTTYEPLSQEETRTEAAHSIIVVTTDLDRSLDADMVGIASLKAYVPATGLSIQPRENDQVDLPGRTGRFVIRRVRPYDPDGVPIAYEIFLGKP